MTKLIHITNVPESLVFLRGQPRHMQDHGFDVEIVSSPGMALDAFGAQESVGVRGIAMKRSISPVADVGSIWNLVKYFRQDMPAIVHAHTPKGGLLGMISAWVARVPVRIYHIRGFPYMTATGMTRKLLMWSERLSCLLADTVLCVSPSIRKVAIEDGICPPDKIIVFGGGSGNGVDALGVFNPDRFSKAQRCSFRADLGIDEQDLVIGYVGRLAHDKGIDELAGAWQGLRNDFPTAHLVLVGREDERDPVSPQTLDALRRDDRVHFTGEVLDPSPMYSILDLKILPSYREGFGNVLIEAASMGVPTIACDIPGCRDAIQDGVTGSLIPAHDTEALCRAMHRYLKDEQLRTRHGDAGRKRVLAKFLNTQIWESVRSEYGRLLKARGIPVPQSNERSATAAR